ncbi:hypothetical protein GALMADRAFT_722177 [Galerina marginata CBS 339.88]|uniref:Uncharacterized protein n=1 Tax=Galerina marginata (strain CBS 339.88) TaxID=685588 RepID=A0A067SQH2_GALM3|nr:hypothetical protein GALMADRAFT_722177 [Galerina marginata CBS 339.88]
MLAHGRIRLPMIVYFISRLETSLLVERRCVQLLSRFGSLATLLSEAIMLTAPVGHCENIRYIQFLFLLSVPPTSFLFLFRVHALYLGNKFVTGFFSLMWLAVVGACLTPVLGVSGAYIGTTQYCIHSQLEPYVTAACIVPFLNDILIFLATSWKLFQNAHAAMNIKNGVRIMIFGDYLPALSRGILKDGQAYFLTIIALNLATAILFNNSAVPLVYRTFIGTPNIVLMNSMACHIFRNTRLGVYRESVTLPTINVIPEDSRGPLSIIAFHNEVASSTSGSRSVELDSAGIEAV